MRMMKRNRGLWTLGAVAVGALALAHVASASTDVTTEQSGSVVVFPKVVWDGTRDTIITLSNTMNPMAHAHCFYINGAVPGQCTETDFDLWLTKRQPTHWVASQGRPNSSGQIIGPNAGFSPGLIPPVPLGFVGELKCVQVMDDGTPVAGNALKGEAVLRRIDGDVAGYNAIALQGNTDANKFDPRQDPNNPNDLVLDLTPNTSSTGGDNTGSYSACPDTLLLTYFVHGIDDPVIEDIGDCDASEGGCPVKTTLTLVPCQEDLENARLGKVTANFDVFDEFERRLSGGISVNCYLSAPLNQISPALTAIQIIGSETAYARITPAPGSGGMIGIAEETRFIDNQGTPSITPQSATTAFNLRVEGNRFDAATDGKGVGVDTSGTNHSLPCPDPNNPTLCPVDHIIIPEE